MGFCGPRVSGKGMREFLRLNGYDLCSVLISDLHGIVDATRVDDHDLNSIDASLISETSEELRQTASGIERGNDYGNEPIHVVIMVADLGKLCRFSIW